MWCYQEGNHFSLNFISFINLVDILSFLVYHLERYYISSVCRLSHCVSSTFTWVITNPHHFLLPISHTTRMFIYTGYQSSHFFPSIHASSNWWNNKNVGWNKKRPSLRISLLWRKTCHPHDETVILILLEIHFIICVFGYTIFQLHFISYLNVHHKGFSVCLLAASLRSVLEIRLQHNLDCN